MTSSSTRRAAATALLIAAAAAMPLSAQGSTTVWTFQASIPDSAQGMTMGITEFDLRLTAATDGQRIGVQVEPGPMLRASVPGLTLSGSRLQMIVPAAGDSVLLGVVFPPEIAAQMGAAVGWHLGFAIPDSIPIDKFSPDSIAAAQEEMSDATIRTDKSDVVAGVPCKVWQITAKADSTDARLPVAEICVADSLPAMAALTGVFKRHLVRLGVDLDEWFENSVDTFGSRDAVVVRTVDAEGSGFRIELLSATATAPDASFFELPPGLSPVPPELMQMFVQGARAAVDEQ